MPEREGLLWELEGRLGVPVRRCFGCRKCSCGCPMVEEFDYPPHHIVRLVQLGIPDTLKGSSALEFCTGCGTCGQRCPNGITAGEVVNALRRRFGEPGRAGIFHAAFMGQVRRQGRIHELTLAGRYVMRSKDFTTHAATGLALLRRGKLPMLPTLPKGRARREVAALFEPGGGAGR